jgi:uncharacterized damage-inducible protein DinB
MMKQTEFFLAQLEREAPLSRRVLEVVPQGKADWKPHEKSMPLGYLATLVAVIPSWIEMAINRDELDLKPLKGPSYTPPPTDTLERLLAAQADAVAQAKAALSGTTDAHLATPWKLLVSGHEVMSQPRSVVITDTFCHSAHHRGQLTVYLRLNGAKVPSVYGPSADDNRY